MPSLNAEVEGGEFEVCSDCLKYGKKKKVYQPLRSTYNKKPVAKQEFRLVSNFSLLIRQAREAKGMSHEEFSKYIQEKESILSKWENGTLRPRFGIARILERKLGVKLLEKDVKVAHEKTKAEADELTLGDFIKVRRRN